MGSREGGIQNFVSKRLGSLWVVQQYLKRLGVQERIDSACPIESHTKLTHGQVISVLVGNRLNSPTPLYQVGQWAKLYAAEEVLGTPASLLNDDRIGRALDAIYPHLETLKGSIGWRAISEFGIDTAVWHWDFTSLSFHGAYAEQTACRANRARQMERAEGIFRKVEGNLETRWYDTPQKVHDALKKGLQKLRIEPFYTVRVGTTENPRSGGSAMKQR